MTWTRFELLKGLSRSPLWQIIRIFEPNGVFLREIIAWFARDWSKCITHTKLGKRANWKIASKFLIFHQFYSKKCWNEFWQKEIMNHNWFNKICKMANRSLRQSKQVGRFDLLMPQRQRLLLFSSILRCDWKVLPCWLQLWCCCHVDEISLRWFPLSYCETGLTAIQVDQSPHHRNILPWCLHRSINRLSRILCQPIHGHIMGTGN